MGGGGWEAGKERAVCVEIDGDFDVRSMKRSE